MERLFISGVSCDEVVNLSGLMECKNINTVGIFYANITDISALYACKKLRTLDLKGSTVTSMYSNSYSVANSRMWI